MQPNRRQFIYLIGGAAGSTLSGNLAGRATESGTERARPECVAVRQSARAFGTDVTITARHPDAGVARQAIQAAFGELATVEAVMSLYRPSSEVCKLNRHGQLTGPHPYLIEVLQQAKRFSRLSDGAFDITVQPLWKVYAEAFQQGHPPDRADVQAARQAIGWRRISLTKSKVSLTNPGTQITLNGIAQGFAADRAIAALRANGVENAIVDTGELGGIGQPARSGAWTAGIQHPRHPDSFIGVAQLANRCLATSGDYATTFSPDRAYNHLFDPSTGASPGELASVSVLAPSAVEADALSTAVCVLGAERGHCMIAQMPGVDMFAVTKSGRSMATAGFALQALHLTRRG